MKRLALIIAFTASTAHASGPTSPRIEPEPLAPAECQDWTRYLPFVGKCHEPFDYINPEGDPFDVPTKPEPPKPTPCSSLDVPGAVLANGGGKKCATLS